MKILLAFPQADQQTGVYIKNALEKLGHELQVLDSKVNPYDLYSMTESFQPDMIFCSRTIALLESIKKIKNDFPRIKRVCWNVDTRDSVLEFGDLLELYDNMNICYTIAKGNIDEYKKNCPNAEFIHMQEGIDPVFHNDFGTDPHYECDVLFAGDYLSTVHHGRNELLQYLAESVNLNVYGRESYLLNKEHSLACRTAKICLGHSGWPDVEISMSARDYRIMGAGGFLLTNHVKGIENWFKVGVEMDTYKSKEECLEKIKYYLNEPFKRKLIAKAGYDIVHAKHKFEDRLRSV